MKKLLVIEFDPWNGRMCTKIQFVMLNNMGEWLTKKLQPFCHCLPEENQRFLNNVREAIWEDLKVREFYQNWIAWLIGRIKLPSRVQGARLDGKTISIDIGPIRLRNAYMVGSKFDGIGLSGAVLGGIDFREVNLNDVENIDIEYLSYAKACGAILNDRQIRKTQEWEAQHQNAPWLQNPDVDAHIVRDYIEKCREG